MDRLYKACTLVQELQSIKGKNDKQQFVADNATNEDFLNLLWARLNPFMSYKMKVIPEFISNGEADLTYDEFKALALKLSANNINAAARKEVVETLKRADYRIVDVLKGIITKTLSLGMDTGVNKALGTKFIPAFNVMLAAPLKEGVDIPIPCQVDVKYDGVRVLAMIEGGECTLYTRKGRVLNFPKIEKELLTLSSGADLTFDGELEMEARTGISGVCNSNLKTGYVEGSDDIIKCTLFDMLPTVIFKDEGTSKVQSERTLELQKLFANVKLGRVQLAETQTVHSVDKLMEINKKYIADGLEGVIAKDPNAPYHFKRNKAWLKLKAINSTTLKVIGTEEGKGKRKGKVGALVCESECGQVVVKVGSGMSDDLIDLFTKVSPIGKYAEILFNVLIKPKDGEVYSLFLPRLKPGEAIRIDKSEADSLEKILEDHIGKPEI